MSETTTIKALMTDSLANLGCFPGQLLNMYMYVFFNVRWEKGWCSAKESSVVKYVTVWVSDFINVQKADYQQEF